VGVAPHCELGGRGQGAGRTAEQAQQQGSLHCQTEKERGSEEWELRRKIRHNLGGSENILQVEWIRKKYFEIKIRIQSARRKATAVCMSQIPWTPVPLNKKYKMD
jgi:hypothetical protein